MGLSLLTHLRRQDFPVRGNKPLDRMELQSLGPHLFTCLNSTSSSSLLHGPFFMYPFSNALSISQFSIHSCQCFNCFFFVDFLSNKKEKHTHNTQSKNQSSGWFIYGVRKLLKMEWMSGRVRVWLDSWVTGCNLVPVPGSILVFGLSCCDVAEFYWVCCSGFTWTERTGLLLPLALGTVLTVSGEHPQPRHFFFVLKLKFKLNTFFIFIHCLITLCFFSQKKLHYVWTKW